LPIDYDLRVFIVADDLLAKAGLISLLADYSDYSIVGDSGTDADLADEMSYARADVIIWDLGWSTGDSSMDMYEAIAAQIATLSTPVIALVPDDTFAADVFSAGVKGLMFREADVDQLGTALLAVARGLIVIHPDLESFLMRAERMSETNLIEELTPRESEVLQLLAEGLPNKIIAKELGISEHTVKYHVNAILGKLDAQSRTEAVVRATRMGLIIL
jgi:DNA-binding NarL/FixJ family response regulator